MSVSEHDAAPGTLGSIPEVELRYGMVKTIEVRAVPEPDPQRSAADVFAELGPWEGETTEEILAILAAARRRGGQRGVPAL